MGNLDGDVTKLPTSSTTSGSNNLDGDVTKTTPAVAPLAITGSGSVTADLADMRESKKLLQIAIDNCMSDVQHIRTIQSVINPGDENASKGFMFRNQDGSIDLNTNNQLHISDFQAMMSNLKA